MKNVLNSIQFWILVFFLVRLIGITNPPLETGHNWRQATGLMVARNFLEVDANILYPRVDDTKGETGIIGMEFPSMNYLYFLISKVFGHSHWYGRLINLIISSLGLFYFHRLICLLAYSKRIAFASTIFLGASIWFSFSRKMMPDTYCISLVLIGLFYGIKYVAGKKVIDIVLYILISSLAILSKIPAGIYFILLIPFLFSQKYGLKQRMILFSSTLIPLLLTYVWYFEWNPYLANTYGSWYNIGKPLATGFTEITDNAGKTLKNFWFHSFSSYMVITLFIAGLALMLLKKERKIITAFFLLFSIFLLYVFKSGYIFYHHNYYIIPFVPMMAFIAGYAVSYIRKTWLYVTLLTVGVCESIANQQHDFFIKKSEWYKINLESLMNSVSHKDDLILINGNGNPQLIYLSHRKGWDCVNENLLDTNFINGVIARDCQYIVVNKHTFKERLTLKRLVYEDDDFIIYAVGDVSGNDN